MTHYETLGIPENANQDEIKKAYRKLANQHHPDKGGDTTHFQKIQAAYDAISDEQRRARYDAERRGIGGFRFNVNGQDIDGMPHEMEEMLRNFGFGFSFGPGFANQNDPFSRFRQPRKNKDIQVDIVVTLSSTLQPQTKTISVQNTNGERYQVDVNVPRGVQPNAIIKYPGLGDNFFNTLERGDLYVKIHVKNDSNFTVENLDLIQKFDITCIQAMLGHTITITGLDNRQFDVNIPAGTQNGTKLRLQNQGLYEMNQNYRGALITVINITVPQNLTEEQIQILQNLFPNH